MPKNKKRILVIEDDPGILEALEMVLSEKGFDLKFLSTGNILKQSETINPDLILLDISIAGVDGGKLCKKLKRSKITGKTPVIMISGDINIGKIAEESGADSYLEKPFGIEELIQIVDNHTKNAPIIASI